MSYYAHYDEKRNIKQLLHRHLEAAAEHAEAQVPPNVRFNGIDSAAVKQIAHCLGCYHDLGKYSRYFQNYLLNGADSHLKNHAHISACFVYALLADRLELPQDKQKRIAAFIAYLCVRLHHRALTLDGLFPLADKEMWQSLNKIAQDLLSGAADILQDSGNFANTVTMAQFEKYLQTDLLPKDKKNFLYMPQYLTGGRADDDSLFFLTVYLFSLLIDSDKIDAAGVKTSGVKSIPPEHISNYLAEKQTEKSNPQLLQKREDARRTMLDVINSLDDKAVRSRRFFTLTAPTGIGKTLASLQCALLLQQKIKKAEGYTPRIIAAIPFINIIEQTKKEYLRIINDELRLIVHHRLGDITAHRQPGEETPLDQALLEVEAWEGDIILTTFVQLFQSIFTNKNRPLKKINKLAGSIVILDEAQAVPEKYMPLIGAVLQKISACWGTRFILMTATQPKILEFGTLLTGDTSPAKTAVSLLPDYPRYFAALNRTKFVPLLNEKLTTEKFISLFQQKWDGSSSALIVVNTIKRSIEVYQELTKKLRQSSCQVPVYYLSTNIVPLKRSAVIKEVKELLDGGRPVILVSTQTIEAGVDLDFDIAFRDFAPLDSLIQTAGRVNREGRKGKYLPVYIVQLESDNHYVYTLMHRKSTEDLLKQRQEILEPDYGKLAERYYTAALARGVSDISKELWQCVLRLNFAELNKFNLIENTGEAADVFVELDERASLLADTYEQLLQWNQNDIDNRLKQNLQKLGTASIPTAFNAFARKALLRLIAAKMNDYIIQVRISAIKTNRPPEFAARNNVQCAMYWIPPGQLQDYYCQETGFISKNGEAFMF